MTLAFDQEPVFLITVGYKDYAFFQEKDALEAWRVLSKGYELETSWRVSKKYVNDPLNPSLKCITVWNKELVMQEEEAQKQAEAQEKEQVNE